MEIGGPDTASTTTKQSTKKFGVVNTARLNVREEASKESTVLKVIEKNEKVEIKSAKNKEWFKVKVAGVEGYCMKEYIDKEN